MVCVPFCVATYNGVCVCESEGGGGGGGGVVGGGVFWGEGVVVGVFLFVLFFFFRTILNGTRFISEIMQENVHSPRSHWRHTVGWRVAE